MNICDKLNIKLNKNIKDIDFFSVTEDGLSNFIEI